MAGHSKWANIKRRKAVVDAAKSRVWTKVIKEITVAARDGGADPAGNPRLSLAIDNAKAANMPKDNIDRAIKKGVGDEKDAAAFHEVVYEGYGPGGIAYIVETTTDNLNRTVGEIRHIFSKYGGNMGTNGSVSYLFEHKGVISIQTETIGEDDVMMAAIEAGAEDIKTEDGYIEVTTRREDLYAVRNALEGAGIKTEHAELQYVPMTTVKIEDDHIVANFKLMEKMEENDDVSNVFNNMEMDEHALALAENL